MIVREVMSSEPYVATVVASLGQIVRIVREGDVRHVPIVEDGRLVGIVSDRDLLAWLPTDVERFDEPQRMERILSQPVSNLMSTDLLSVQPEDDVVDAIDLMLEHKLGALPVVEAGSEKLVGIVSYIDLLRAARETML